MAARIRYEEVAQGEELKPWSYRVTREDLVAYASASGDQNPIHQDDAFAKSVGLPDVIAHGMHTMARIGQFVTDWLGDPGAVVRFKARFSAMVVVPKNGGSQVTVSGTITDKLDGKRARIELVAQTEDTGTAAKAEAEVQLI